MLTPGLHFKLQSAWVLDLPLFYDHTDLLKIYNPKRNYDQRYVGKDYKRGYAKMRVEIPEGTYFRVDSVRIAGKGARDYDTIGLTLLRFPEYIENQLKGKHKKIRNFRLSFSVSDVQGIDIKVLEPL